MALDLISNRVCTFCSHVPFLTYFFIHFKIKEKKSENVLDLLTEANRKLVHLSGTLF